MINFEEITKNIESGLKQYLLCPVIKGNQVNKPPRFPYIVYNIITLAENKGTWQEHNDLVDRKQAVMTISFSSHSDVYRDSLELSIKAREWLELVGTTYLNGRGIIVQSVSDIHDRSNFATIEYMYSYGFDCFIWLYDEVNHPVEKIGTIETVELSGKEI